MRPLRHGEPMPTSIVDIDPDHPRLPEMHEVLRHLRTELTLAQLREIYAEGFPQGLRFTAVDEDGRLVAVAGWRLVACTTAGRRLYIDDLVTDPAVRSAGHGHLLLAELERRAREAGCRDPGPRFRRSPRRRASLLLPRADDDHLIPLHAGALRFRGSRPLPDPRL